jgi:hypothetical protein
MPGFFDALQKFKPKERDKPTVIIQGQKIEVDQELFRQVQLHGQENFKIKDGKIQRIPPRRFKKTYCTLKKSDKGYIFYDGDPYWPEGYGKGGFEWEDELESQI